jgi:hypothetical protein
LYARSSQRGKISNKNPLDAIMVSEFVDYDGMRRDYISQMIAVIILAIEDLRVDVGKKKSGMES